MRTLELRWVVPLPRASEDAKHAHTMQTILESRELDTLSAVLRERGWILALLAGPEQSIVREQYEYFQILLGLTMDGFGKFHVRLRLMY